MITRGDDVLAGKVETRKAGNRLFGQNVVDARSHGAVAVLQELAVKIRQDRPFKPFPASRRFGPRIPA